MPKRVEALLFGLSAVACFLAAGFIVAAEIEFIAEKIMFLIMVGILGIGCAGAAWGNWRDAARS